MKIFIAIYIFVVLAQMSYWGSFSLSKIYCVECFDTEIRASSTGWRSFSYALGLTFGLLISSWLTTFIAIGYVFILNSLWVIILVPLVVWKMLPETKGIGLIEE
jgi:MFS family permease